MTPGAGPAAATPGVNSCCPRCGAAFACGIGGPTPCACTGITLSPAQLDALRGRYRGCLCLACLRDLAADTTLAPAGTPP
jgi:Cysteine-rich CWC